MCWESYPVFREEKVFVLNMLIHVYINIHPKLQKNVTFSKISLATNFLIYPKIIFIFSFYFFSFQYLRISTEVHKNFSQIGKHGGSQSSMKLAVFISLGYLFTHSAISSKEKTCQYNLLLFLY